MPHLTHNQRTCKWKQDVCRTPNNNSTRSEVMTYHSRCVLTQLPPAVLASDSSTTPSVQAVLTAGREVEWRTACLPGSSPAPPCEYATADTFHGCRQDDVVDMHDHDDESSTNTRHYCHVTTVTSDLNFENTIQSNYNYYYLIFM